MSGSQRASFGRGLAASLSHSLNMDLDQDQLSIAHTLCTIFRNFLVSMLDRVETFIQVQCAEHRSTRQFRRGTDLQVTPTFSIIPTRRYLAAVKGSSDDYLLRFDPFDA